MKKKIIIVLLSWTGSLTFAQDWNGIPVPPSAGAGKVWELQPLSDDFNYTALPDDKGTDFNAKWTDFYHNAWTGPSPTVWKRNHSYVSDGNLKIKASRPTGTSITNTGCITSKQRVIFPVYVETYVKITNSVLASDVWMLSPDDTQEIDICEAYGSDRYTNDWFSPKRLHLSHHVFIRSPFQDWQPSDEGSFYTDGSTVWRNDFHRIGVYWKDPWNLEYYVDGKLVRTRSGVDQIDPKNFTNGTGLSKEMDIIINTEDQTWRANQGLTPTLEELANEENNTFKVDWIRIYKPVDGEVGEVTGVTLDKTEVTSFIGSKFTLTASVIPNNANNLSVTWSSDKPEIATVSSEGLVECKAAGEAFITVTTSENQKTAVCKVIVSADLETASVAFDDESKYLNTIYKVGDNMEVICRFNAGSGNTVTNSGGGVNFWLREIKPGWAVAKDYFVSDASAIGKESGTATGIISLKNVPASSEIPAENWYFLYVTFKTSDGKSLDKGIYPIQIERATGIEEEFKSSKLNVFPNPVTESFQINSKELIQQVVICQTTGAVFKKEVVNDYSITFSTSMLKAGIYILKIQFDDGSWTSQKLIKY